MLLQHLPNGRELHPQGRVVNDEPCKPACPICTDTTAPQDWDGPYQAFRWSPELEETE